MSLKDLNDAGVSDLLEQASLLIRKRGLAKGVRINPDDGSIDLIAALALTGGATEADLMSSVTLHDFRLIPMNEARFVAAYDVLDAILMRDPEEWADHSDTTTSEVAKLLSDASWRLKVSVI